MLNKKTILFSLLICCYAFVVLWPCTSFAITAKDKYFKAETCYKKLRNNPKKYKYRHNWLRCIEKFHTVYKYDPKGSWAAAGLYMSGELYGKLYKVSSRESDRQETIDIFERVVKQFPKSKYKGKAIKKIRVFSKEEKNKKKVSTKKKSLSEKKKLKKDIKPSKTNKVVTITGLRYWSNPSYTRIVIDADKDTIYNHRLLRKDTSIQKPKRLYVDLQNSRLGDGIKKTIPINDDLLSDARAGQFTADIVRVVVDIKSFKTYKIFSLKNPFRVVIDVWGTEAKRKTSELKTAEKNKKFTSSALAKQLALGVNCIVIDPGHGGRDFGASGYLKGVYEKDVVLKIAKMLAKKIHEEVQCEVFLTRTRDRYLTLEERTAIANTKNADLFISIHTNAARSRKAFGIETYFLNLATDNESILVAARENATSTKNISDLQTILSDLMQNAKINESSRLAGHVQTALCNCLKKNKYGRINNKGVKQAPFYVLLGAQMPAILIETSFISNPKECKRLINPKYQERLCEAIVDGIKKYIKETNPTAFHGFKGSLKTSSFIQA
ncbi:MAG: N-acetylmuramoyl-L-alanine amidase [Desulfobacteraceae bacterium]|nr:N-acetylmuramoyl-L-alanine amidase [Desulfobacteraceae bacterium]MBC2717995.1 N-acetylmuramoyl-L-alanine amidase [Desulfobacteraceae bacterium]